MAELSRLFVWAICAGLGCSGATGATGDAPLVLAPSEWRAPEPSDPGPSDPGSNEPGPSNTGSNDPGGSSGPKPLLIHTEPGDIPHLELAGEPKRRLTLEHTHVSARLTGFVAEVEVSQTYTNPFPRPIEAVYVFPLPENSAVNHMRMVIEKRVIEADVKERAQARRVYESARARGHTAALLEQERPNVFTQSVANIEPGKKIDVVVRYLQNLSYDSGEYEFVFPMVVGPRFMPGQPTEGPPSGSGSHPDTTAVPDASRISPPYVGRGQRTGRDISLDLVADAGVALRGFEVPTHDVAARRPADGTLRMTLAEKASIPNRDFVLRYRVAQPEPHATLFVGEKESARGASSAETGFFSLVVWPPDLDVDELVGEREFVFVVDVSGSMTGLPLAMCKSAMRTALRRVRPVDTFNILTFAGATRRAFESPRPANTENVRSALAVVDGLYAGGGTHMADAVAAALGPDIAPGRHRYVFFLTDGYVGNEDAIISASRAFVEKAVRNRQRARVFGFGVGSSVNRHLIDGLSRAGDGVAVYATAREDPERAVDRFFHYADRAVLEKLEIDWGGLEVSEPMPKPLPDLFASHAVTLHGRYSGKPGGKVVVRGRARGKTVEIPVRLERSPAELHGARVLGTLWAREKVAFLEQGRAFGDRLPDDEIRALGLEFHLVTRFTSLVAVDESRRVGDGNPDKVIEALDEPEGVDVDMAGGARAFSKESYDYTYDEEEGAYEGDPGARPELMTGQLTAAQSVRMKRGGCGCRLQDEPRATPWATLLFALGLAVGLFGRRTSARYSASTREGVLARSRSGRSLDAAGEADGRTRPASS